MDAVLILHGLGSSNESDKVRWFSDNLGMEVFAPNFPQHGDNDEEFSVPLILNQVEELILRMNDFDKKYLIARSFGGYVALLVLKKYFNFFDKVCLLSPAINMEEVMQILVDDGYVSPDFKVDGRQFVGPSEFRDFDVELRDIDFEVPTLVIQGDGDEVTKLDTLKDFVEGKKNCEVRVFKTGHDYDDCVEEIEMAVRDWVLNG